MSTWPFGLPVCDSTQPKDNSALILLHDLQAEKHRTHQHQSDATDTGNCGFFVLFCFSLFEAERWLLSSLTLTQNQIVMGKRTMTKMEDSRTKIHPTHPRDPVCSARWIEKCDSEANS